MWKRGNKSKALTVFQYGLCTILITSLILAVFLLVILFSKDTPNTSLSFGPTKQKWNSFEPSIQTHPALEFRNGTNIIWQIPDSPKAVLFLAHGCNAQAINFWDKSPHCPSCVGLPEERLIVLHALARNFAVLTISSAGRCWTFGEEMNIVKDIISWWVQKNKIEHLNLVALGASSGGFFVSGLATVMKFSSITLMVSEGMFDQMDVNDNYPPTLFVHMPKDVYRQQKIGENMEVLRSKGVDVAEIECMEFPLSPHFLADRIPGIDQSVSTKLFEMFQNKGFIYENGFMRNDGRKTRWKSALRENKIVLPDQRLANHIQEELNLAYAYHEMTSLHSNQIFKWFESHLS